MVYEFPELQGLMGRYYIEASGEDAQVAAAAEEHYAPLGPSDDVPTAPVSVAVSLAEKIDKLTGFWAIDEKPTGSKDPFALRRAALGVIRILVENDLSCPIQKPFGFSFDEHRFHNTVRKETTRSKIYARTADALSIPLVDFEIAIKSLREKKFDSSEDFKKEFTGQFSGLKMAMASLTQFLKSIDFEAIQDEVDRYRNLLSFIHDRLKVYLKDQGIRHDIIDACIAMPNNDDINLLVKRARALSETLKTDDGGNLIQGFKRANNILSQAETADGVEYSYGADVKFAETDEERALFKALDAAEAKIKPAMESQDFATAMSAMATLRAPIDAFFEAVQINADNPTVRRNRLNLLSRIRTICSSVADLTKIEG